MFMCVRVCVCMCVCVCVCVRAHVDVVEGERRQGEADGHRARRRLGLLDDHVRVLRVEVVHPLELHARVDEALRDADVARPVPLVLGLALGQVRQHRAHRRARHGDARATVGEEGLAHPRDDALEVRRGDESVPEVLRLLAVVPARGREARAQGARRARERMRGAAAGVRWGCGGGVRRARGLSGGGQAYSGSRSSLVARLTTPILAVAALTPPRLNTATLFTIAHSRSVSSSCEWNAKASSSAM